MMSDRRRTIAWEDPVAAAGEALGMSGMERLRNYVAGTVPPSPFALTIDTEITGFGEGSAEITFRPAECHYDLSGSVQAGVLAAVLDSVMGVALQTRLAAGIGFATLEISVNNLRAMGEAAGAIKAMGAIAHLGKRVAFTEGRLLDAEGTSYATATSTFLILRS